MTSQRARKQSGITTALPVGGIRAGGGSWQEMRGGEWRKFCKALRKVTAIQTTNDHFLITQQEGKTICRVKRNFDPDPLCNTSDDRASVRTLQEAVNNRIITKAFSHGDISKVIHEMRVCVLVSVCFRSTEKNEETRNVHTQITCGISPASLPQPVFYFTPSHALTRRRNAAQYIGHSRDRLARTTLTIYDKCSAGTGDET